MLTVRPTAQGTGLGRKLLEAAERWAIDHWSSRSMHMTVIGQRVELIALVRTPWLQSNRGTQAVSLWR